MSKGAREVFLKVVRVSFGLILIAWGIFSLPILFLPGGIWTILLGLAILAIDIPWAKRVDENIKDKIKKNFPNFHKRVVLPVDLLKEKAFKKISSFFDKKEK